MAIVDVWVAQPGSVCRVDDHSWTITIYDAHENVFQWGGTTYADLPAPKAHWVDKMPPGTYVVQGRSADGARTTDHAIVVADCDGTACVHLYVASHKRHGTCTITVDRVEGLAPESTTAGDVRSIRVSGSATDCDQVKVQVSCHTDSGTAIAVVAADGSWSTVVQLQGRGCRCGQPVKVLVACATDPQCSTETTVDALHCE